MVRDVPFVSRDPVAAPAAGPGTMVWLPIARPRVGPGILSVLVGGLRLVALRSWGLVRGRSGAIDAIVLEGVSMEFSYIVREWIEVLRETWTSA